MKHRLFCFLMAMALLSAPAERACAASGLFRLQVIADSDSPSDQAAKLRARDALLPLVQELLQGAGSAEEAVQLARESLDRIESAAAEAAGCPARAEVGELYFSDRICAGALLPAGEYPALRITLGRGTGHNWWCVLYPELCGMDEVTIGDSCYSRLMEWLRSRFGGGNG